ncbi:unnamed protein product [Blepharisma stoltei]|uniref:Vacuolar protein sorting-associated protein 52 homolog n=1 Tax=Blepharisma stoltei TaxID=1481888 RepID=A0AAU9IPE0_9CILI|nr:unnamed protein product [Blepharisma stoltei]
MDLREYSEQTEEQLKVVESECLQDMATCQEELAELYMTVRDSNKIIKNIESHLVQFQSDLKNVGLEIKTLQDQSLSMNVSLSNRRHLEDKLGNFLKQITLTPDLIHNICKRDVDEGFLVYINQLREKMRFFRTQGNIIIEGNEVAAVSMQEVWPYLKRLNMKAAYKVRQFLINHIQSLLKPKTNVQLMQETVLIRYKDMLLYLRENSQETFVEICMNYTEIMSQIYLDHFKVYMSSIKKLIRDDCDKRDVVTWQGMGTDISYVQGFDLKDRHQLLDQIETLDPIICHVARKTHQKFFIERVFQSISRLLVDTCTFCFLFVLEFFYVRFDQYEPVFGEIFSKTQQHLIDNLATIFGTTYDTLALLLVLKINTVFQQTMEKRGMLFMNPYFEKVRIITWPRLQVLLDNNLREMDTANYLHTSDIAYHPVTSRFAQFITSLHKISPEDSMFIHRLSLFRQSFIGLLKKIAKDIRDEKNRAVFIINNLDYLMEEFHEQKVTISQEFGQLEADLTAMTENFIDMQIKELFPAFVKLLETPNPSSGDIDLFLHDFNVNWKKGLQIIEEAVKNLFSGVETQKDILKRTYTKFLMKYTDFVELVKKNHPHLTKSLVSLQVIMAEIQH